MNNTKHCRRCDKQINKTEFNKGKNVCNKHKQLEYQKGGKEGATKVGGYSGLKNTAKNIVEYFPNLKRKTYVEPFAGMATTYRWTCKKGNKPNKAILTDMSEYAIKINSEEFPEALCYKNEYMSTLEEYDSEDTVFLVDPPWYQKTYKNNPLAHCENTPKEYYMKIIEFAKRCKGHIIICSEVREIGLTHILTDSGLYRAEVKSDKKVLFGLHARTALWSNKEFDKI